MSSYLSFLLLAASRFLLISPDWVHGEVADSHSDVSWFTWKLCASIFIQAGRRPVGLGCESWPHATLQQFLPDVVVAEFRQLGLVDEYSPYVFLVCQ